MSGVLPIGTYEVPFFFLIIAAVLNSKFNLKFSKNSINIQCRKFFTYTLKLCVSRITQTISSNLLIDFKLKPTQSCNHPSQKLCPRLVNTLILTILTAWAMRSKKLYFQKNINLS